MTHPVYTLISLESIYEVMHLKKKKKYADYE